MFPRPPLMLFCSLVVVSVTAGSCSARNTNAATTENATSAPADRREFAREEATLTRRPPTLAPLIGTSTTTAPQEVDVR